VDGWWGSTNDTTMYIVRNFDVNDGWWFIKYISESLVCFLIRLDSSYVKSNNNFLFMTLYTHFRWIDGYLKNKSFFYFYLETCGEWNEESKENTRKRATMLKRRSSETTVNKIDWEYRVKWHSLLFFFIRLMLFSLLLPFSFILMTFITHFQQSSSMLHRIESYLIQQFETC
jgi:hypothetical protein